MGTDFKLLFGNRTQVSRFITNEQGFVGLLTPGTTQEETSCAHTHTNMRCPNHNKETCDMTTCCNQFFQNYASTHLYHTTCSHTIAFQSFTVYPFFGGFPDSPSISQYLTQGGGGPTDHATEVSLKQWAKSHWVRKNLLGSTNISSLVVSRFGVCGMWQLSWHQMYQISGYPIL